jgi:beta-glucosidase
MPAPNVGSAVANCRQSRDEVATNLKDGVSGMRTLLWVIAGLTACIAPNPCLADVSTAPAYLKPSLSPEARAADLVRRMTPEEKASQLVNHSRDIPRLGVPAYDWWSEALHGVAVKGTTEFPEPIGLAATFDTASIHAMAEAIGVEGRIKHAQDVRAGHSTTFEGLDFWAPNINIFRDPRWGRGQETYGEDPFLTARMAVAYVTGMQGNDPQHYRAIATPKHYAVHSGPEPTRHFADVDVSKHDMEDTYLPAFRAAVIEARAGSVMCAYNAINGEPACASQFLLQHVLRGAWKFRGYVVSDCGAVHDIFEGHRFRASQPEATAVSLMRGMDNECITFGEVKDHDDYQPYLDAMRRGYLPQQAVDTALIRLFTARMRLGMFDPPGADPYSRIPESELDSPTHRQLSLKLAEESMVLLKNDGVLPLKGAKRIAIVGPLADQTEVMLGNYHGTPTHVVSMLEGMRAAFPGSRISFVPGTQFLSNAGEPIPAAMLKSGYLTAAETGDYRVGVTANGTARISVDGRMIAQTYGGTSVGRTHLEKGVPAKLEVTAPPDARLFWRRVDDTPDPAAVAAARDADVVVAVVGITSALEGEEMPVSEPGFDGGDRTNIDIPAPEEALVRAVAATGKPLVVVLMNGSALAARWEKEHANAIVEAWYPGEEGGRAIANTLSGANNPSGRLPVTFYAGVDQLPKFEDYSMKGRTYRYFTSTPLWPFGHGLSYTQFSYTSLNLPQNIRAGQPLRASAVVRNSGAVAGDEVVQLYLTFPKAPSAPIRALRAFRRIHLEPGASERVSFELQPRDLSMVNPVGDIVVAAGKYGLSLGGGQPGSGAPAVTADFSIAGQLGLPE